MTVSVSAFSGEVKHAILTRQAGRCAYCGMPCTIGHFHHRKPRRMGGSGDPAVGMAANGVMLHPRCHDRMESDREWALTRGWLLSDRQDPEKVPVKMWDGWRLLANDGSVTKVTVAPPLDDARTGSGSGHTPGPHRTGPAAPEADTPSAQHADAPTQR